MLASFKKIVKDETSSLSIPKEILYGINSQIPASANAEYVDTGDGACLLTPKPPYNDFSMQLYFPGVKILSKLPDDIKTQRELFDYMYRTQTTIHCRINGVGKAIFNGIEINLNEMMKFPLQNVTIGERIDLYISPSPFPSIPPISVAAAGFSVLLSAKRVPEHEKNLVVISVGEDSWLKMRFVINTETFKVNVTINFDYAKCKTVKEFVVAMKMSNGLICGNYSISCLNISSPLSIREPIKDSFIDLWEKVGKLESILHVSFTPNLSLTMSEAIELNQLFRSFLENKPFATTVKPEPNIGLHIADTMDLDQHIGESAVFTYTHAVSWNLLGAKFETVNLCSIFGANVASITKDDSKSETPFFVQLTPTGNKEITLATQIFPNSEAVEAFQNSFNNYTEFLEAFSQAEEICAKF